jgi:hypothetical protein
MMASARQQPSDSHPAGDTEHKHASTDFTEYQFGKILFFIFAAFIKCLAKRSA